MRKYLVISIAAFLVTGMLVNFSSAVQADDGCNDNSSAIINIGVSGNLTVDISASGPGQLQVKASGPAMVWICSGKECQLAVEAEAPAEININKDCEPAINQYKPNIELDIIPGVLRVQGLSLFNKNGENLAGRLVVYLLGSRYEI